jgi:hypothetical protein
MIDAAVVEAKGRLKKAKESLARLRAADNFEDFRSAWSDFLIATAGFYSKLESGTKNSPHAAWFGRKKHERKADSLLQYMHQARNADEHGIEPVAHFGGRRLIVGGLPGQSIRVQINSMSIDHADFTATADVGEPIVHYTPVVAKLVPVKNHGVLFEPPTEFNGKRLDDDRPETVGELLVMHLDRIIEEASQLA